MPRHKERFVDPEEIAELKECAAMQMSITEMAHLFGCERQTIMRPDVMAIVEEARSGTKKKLRKLMVRRALYEGEDPVLLNISQKALEHCHKWYLDHREQKQVAEEVKQNTFLPPIAQLDEKVE